MFMIIKDLGTDQESELGTDYPHRNIAEAIAQQFQRDWPGHTYHVFRRGRPLDWAVTFDRVTIESVEHGDAAERGYITEGASLREAISHFRGETDDGGPSLSDDGSLPEPDCLPFDKDGPSWITQTFSLDDPDEGLSESRTLHFPEWVTPSSRIRLCRLLDVYGTPAANPAIDEAIPVS